MLAGEKRTPTCQVSLNKAAWNAVALHTYTRITNSFLGPPAGYSHSVPFQTPDGVLVYSVLFSSHQVPLTRDRYTVLLRGSKQSHKQKRTARGQSFQWEVAPTCFEKLTAQQSLCMRICTCPLRGTSPTHPTGTPRDATCEYKRERNKKGGSTEAGFHRPPSPRREWESSTDRMSVLENRRQCLERDGPVQRAPSPSQGQPLS